MITHKNALLPLGLALLMTTACVVEEDPDTEPEPETVESSLEMTYIAGHFGNYSDCPDGPQQGAPDGAQADADCAEGENCGGIFNCEGAQVTLRLSNIGDGDASDIQLIDLLVIDAEGEARASLDMIQITPTEGGAFDGTLAAGQSIDLRIDFDGPRDLRALLADPDADDDGRLDNSNSAGLRIILKAADEDAASLDTPNLSSLPSVDT